MKLLRTTRPPLGGGDQEAHPESVDTGEGDARHQPHLQLRYGRTGAALESTDAAPVSCDAPDVESSDRTEGSGSQGRWDTEESVSVPPQWDLRAAWTACAQIFDVDTRWLADLPVIDLRAHYVAGIDPMDETSGELPATPVVDLRTAAVEDPSTFDVEIPTPKVLVARRSRMARCAGIVLVAIGLLWAGWIASGGGLYYVGSPSMGTVAPVGALVITRPLAPHQALRVGEIIVFHPRPGESVTFVHRVVEVLPGGAFRSRGDLNLIDDPWIGQRVNIVGRPVAIVPGLGWIYRCSAWFFLGAAVLIGISLTMTERRKVWLLSLGPAILLDVPLFLYRPLMAVGTYRVGLKGKNLVVEMVNTGLIPERLQWNGTHVATIVPGQATTLTWVMGGRVPNLAVTAVPALPIWAWGIVAAVVVLPGLLVLGHELHVQVIRTPRPTPVEPPSWCAELTLAMEVLEALAEVPVDEPHAGAAGESLGAHPDALALVLSFPASMPVHTRRGVLARLGLVPSRSLHPAPVPEQVPQTVPEIRLPSTVPELVAA